MKRSTSTEKLFDELVRRRLIDADSPAVLVPSNDRPWFISIVLGFSGWLAGAFVLVFVGLLFKPDTEAGIALAGLILLLAAFGLYAADRNSEFFDQLALALSIAGQLALAWAAVDAIDSMAATAALVGAMQVGLLLVMPNAFAKALAAFFACCAWALAIRLAWWGEPDFGSARQQVALAPALLGWFVVWTPVIVAVHALVGTERLWMAGGLRRIARAALNGMLVSLCVATWASEPLAGLSFWQEDPARENWLALWPLLGAAGALLASLYAFRLRNYAIIGVGVTGALLHVAQFYYLLGTSLLIKSCIMLGVGIAALQVAAWLRGEGVRSEVEAS